MELVQYLQYDANYARSTIQSSDDLLLHNDPTSRTHLLPPALQLAHTPHCLSSRSSPIPGGLQALLELLIDLLEPLKEALECEDSESRILATSSSTDRVHAQLRDTAVNRPDTRCSTQHRSYSATATAIVADLEYLQLGILFAGADIRVDAALEDSGADSVGGHVSVAIRGDGWTYVKAWGVVLQVYVEEVGVYGVNDVAGDEEGVCVCAGDCVFDPGVCEFLHNALNYAGEEVAAGSLSEKGAHFLVVKQSNDANL